MVVRLDQSPIDITAARKKREAEQTGAAADPEPPVEPLDIIGAPGLVGWPELTPECLPIPLYDYAMVEAERLNVDPCSLAIHILAACATSCSDAWRVKPKLHDHWTQQPRLWTCVVKDVGARGTDILRAAFWPIRKREARLVEQWQRDVEAWEERQASNKKGTKGEPKPAYPGLITRDSTIEAASQSLADGGPHSKLTVLCDELVGFIGGFGRYNKTASTERALWLEAYDGGPQHIKRIIRGNVYVPNWSVVAAGNIQTRRLGEMADSLVDDGLFQRFTAVHTKPSDAGLGDDRPLNPDAGRKYCDLHDILITLMPPVKATGDFASAYFDPDARVVREMFVPLIERLQIDPTLPTIIRETAPKWSGLLARISLIYHLVELAALTMNGGASGKCDMVSGATVAKAATFIRRIVLPNLYRLGFETMPDAGAPDTHARWIAGHILAHHLERVLARDIGRIYRPLRGKPVEIEQAMSVLFDAGWVMPQAARHDSLRWSVNPAVHATFAHAAAVEKDRRERVIKAIREEVTEL